MRKICFLLVLSGALFYSPLSFSDNIVNIGIKSNMAYHVLSNCRFGSALAWESNSVTIKSPSDKKNAKITGLRQKSDKLPNTYRASKVEFDDKGVKDLFGPNVKYSSENTKAYPAALFETWTITGSASTYVYHYDIRVGMTLFSTLPPGVNAASIFNNGEVNFAYRMTDGQGQLECDIYDNAGKLLGLVDYVTDSGPGSSKTLAYGKDQEQSDNSKILGLFKLDPQTVKEYGGSYPKKRILLTISDRNAAPGAGATKDPDGTQNMGPGTPAAAAPARALGSQYQSRVSNATDHYVFRNCTKHDTHGSWTDSPADTAVIQPRGYFTFGMRSKGHGIQGEIRCTILYQEEKGAAEIEMGRLLIEIDNNGTAFAVFPFIKSDKISDQLRKLGFQYSLYVNTDDNFSITVRE